MSDGNGGADPDSPMGGLATAPVAVDPGTEDRTLAESELRYRRLVENVPHQAFLMADTELRIVLAIGDALRANGLDPDSLPGALLGDVIPAGAWQTLGPHYLAALNRVSVDLDYTSPVRGHDFRIRIGPVLGDDGSVIGVLSVSEDVTDERFHQFELEYLHGLSRIGTARYDRQLGWQWDRQLLDMCGIDTDLAEAGATGGTGDPATAIAGLMLPSDRADTLNAWAAVRARGGRCVTSYRIRHGRTGEVRHLQSNQRAVVDTQGRLLHAMATHVDVSDSVIGREKAERARRQASDDRAALLRRASGALAESGCGAMDVFPMIVELAGAALRSGAVLRILTPDRRTIERDVVAHHDQRVQERFADAVRRSTRSIEAGSEIRKAVIIGSRMISTIGADGNSPAYLREFPDDVGFMPEQSIIAPVRHDGTALGLFSVVRSSIDDRFEQADADLVQVLADGMGSAIAERRAQERAEDDQRRLLDHLAETESRERSMLAEAIHDEPMQIIISAMMRLDLMRAQDGFSDPEQGEDIIATLETAVEKLRRLVIAVTAPDFGNGLGVALKNLAEGMFTGTSTTVTVLGDTHVTLAPATKASAYRIAREALVNVRKHAAARTVTVRLTDGEDAVTIAVTDDGLGSAQLDAGAGHLGLLAMRNRARAESGRLTIESTVGRGTTVVLTLPPADRNVLQKGSPLRVFVVDDHTKVREHLARLLDAEEDITVVGQAASVAEARAVIPAAAPDVAVLDVRLPDGDGIGLCRELLTLMPDLRCLMLTSYTDERAMTEALLAGAAGFLLKDVKGMELMDAVRAVGAGRSMLDSRATAALINRLRARSESATDTAPLTGQEAIMLDLIGEGLTNQQIADRTQQSSTDVADDVGRLVSKLGPDSTR